MQQLYLAMRYISSQRDVHGRAPEVTVPLRNLVGQGELISKDCRQDLADRPMVLMGIVAGWRQNEVRRARVRDVLEDVLHPIPDRGKPAFGQLMEVNREIGSGDEGGRGLSCLGMTFFGPSEDYISSTQSGAALGQGEQRPTCSDLDVIRVGAYRQDCQRPFCRQLEPQGEHGPGQIFIRWEGGEESRVGTASAETSKL